MAKEQQPPASWTSWVIECLRAEGEFEDSQVFELLRKHKSQARPGFQKMARLQDIGWPEAREQLLIRGGLRAIVRPDDDEPTVWELKTNPHPWRFYFDIDESNRYITYAYATYKKKTAANAGDVASARKYVARLRNRTGRRKRVDFSRRRD